MLATLALLLPLQAQALTVANNAAEYLLIGTGDSGVGDAVDIGSNFELGANSVSVPMSSTEPLPGNITPVHVGIGGNGDIAITDSTGSFSLSDLNIHGETGVDCAGTHSACESGISSTNYNGSALTTSNGLNGSTDLLGVTNDLATAKSEIPLLASDVLLDFSADGKWDTDLTIMLGAGLTVFDITTGGTDLLLENNNLVFEGGADSFAIIRVPDEANFLITNSNILVGDDGIGLNNVLFYSDKPDTDKHFSFNNNIINGIAFWDLSMQGSSIGMNNAQGCTQLVSDKLELNDVRLNNCAFTPAPEPGTASLLGLGVAALAAQSRRRRRRLRLR